MKFKNLIAEIVCSCLRHTHLCLMLIKMCFAENKPEWIRILVHVVLLGFCCYFYNHVAVTGSVALKADLRTCWTSAIAEWIVSFVAVILHWYLLTRYKYRNTKNVVVCERIGTILVALHRLWIWYRPIVRQKELRSAML